MASKTIILRQLDFSQQFEAEFYCMPAKKETGLPRQIAFEVPL